MTFTMRAGDNRVPMDPMRKTALLAGTLYLVTFVTSIPALGLYDTLLNDPNYILGAGGVTGVLWGAFLEVILALSCIGTALAFHPVLKRRNETAALGFVTSRVIEAAIILVGVLSVLSIVTLRQDAAGGDAATLVTTGQSLVALHDWTFLLGPAVMAGVNALFLATVLYRTRLVPRLIPAMGLVGAPIILASATAILFGAYEQVSTFGMLTGLPIAVWEFSLGVWLVVKGFKPSPLISPAVPAGAVEKGLVSAIA